MSICYKNFPRRLVSALLVMGVSMSIAQAGDRAEKYGGENRGKPVQPSQVNAKFQQECSYLPHRIFAGIAARCILAQGHGRSR